MAAQRGALSGENGRRVGERVSGLQGFTGYWLGSHRLVCCGNSFVTLKSTQHTSHFTRVAMTDETPRTWSTEWYLERAKTILDNNEELVAKFKETQDTSLLEAILYNLSEVASCLDKVKGRRDANFSTVS